ncbi:hypothetical protein LOS20_15300 [Enterococcus faecium]|nr:hypothetical protein [Enterococcus faecium]
MDNDIVPALLEEIQNEFDKRTYNSKKLKKLSSYCRIKKLPIWMRTILQ